MFSNYYNIDLVYVKFYELRLKNEVQSLPQVGFIVI